MAKSETPNAQAQQLLTFYAPELVQLALVCLDADPGRDVFGVVIPSADDLPEGFVGSKHEEIARGVAPRAEMTAFLRRISSAAAEKLAASPSGQMESLTTFVILDGEVLRTTLPLPGRAR